MNKLMWIAALSVAGCGGGGSTPAVPAQKTATVAGGISGMSSGATALLANNGTEIIAVNANGSFKFPTPLAAGAAYSVVLFANPTGNACTVANGSGTVAQSPADIGNIAVTCQPAVIALLTYNVGVTVSGLAAGASVNFADDQGHVIKASTNGLSVFPQPYSPLAVPGANYNVMVSSNPAGQTCTLSNNTGANPVGANFSSFINVIANCK